MKGFFKTIAIFFVCLAVIRVGLGVTGELHMNEILNFLADNNYGTDHVRETIVEYSKISSELKRYKKDLIDAEGNDMRDGMDFHERLQVIFDQVVIYGKFITNTFVLIYRFVELLITELLYLMRIAAYLLFGIAM